MSNPYVDVPADHLANIAQADQLDAALDTLAATPGAGAYVDTLRAELSHTEARIAYVDMLINDTPRHALDRTDWCNI